MTDSANLQRLIDIIDTGLALLPALDTSDRESWKAHDSALGKIIDRLVEQEGAKFGRGGFAGYTLSLAQVKTSCTSGEHGLLKNWCSAVQRKLDAEAQS